MCLLVLLQLPKLVHSVVKASVPRPEPMDQDSSGEKEKVGRCARETTCYNYWFVNGVIYLYELK